MSRGRSRTKMATRIGAPLEFVRERARGLDAPDACVLWPFALFDGYARIDLHGRRKFGHQLVLELAGRLPSERAPEVRHLCGHRACVNLAHLKWGTRSENQRDRFRSHGDHLRGERNPRARLSAQQVADIRRRVLAGERHSALAREYGTARSTISMATTGQTWRAD